MKVVICTRDSTKVLKASLSLFEGVFDWQLDVLMSASIIYAILFILSFLATSYTIHLLSDYFEKDDHYFEQLWKLLGQDKIKTPLPSPHDEEPSPYAYLHPAKGQLISKCPFGFIVWTKIPTKLFPDFCPEFFCSFLGASWKLLGLPGDLT